MRFLNAFAAIGRVLVFGAIASAATALAFSGDARVGLLTVAFSIGITGVVFVGIGRRLGTVSSLDKQLRANGVPSPATITSLRETGVTVNGSPVIEFGLEVDSAAHAPYSTTIKQRSPRLLLGGFLPGSAVTVLVDPADRQHLAIDWDAGAEVVSSGALPSQIPVAGRVRDAAELLRTGRHATALVTSMEDAGDMSELGLIEVGAPGDDDRLMIIALEVKQPGMGPYEVRVAHRVPERLLGRVGPRTRLEVAIDRGDDQVLAIDWDSVGR